MASPVMSAASSGLPPTPPTGLPDDNGHLATDGKSAAGMEGQLHAQGKRGHAPRQEGTMQMAGIKSEGLSTPVNARSPPTPDPSPPRAGAKAQAYANGSASGNTKNSNLDRPVLQAYPSSRAESFETAREHVEDSEEDGDDGGEVQLGEERGLGLAFERERERSVTPTNRRHVRTPINQSRHANGLSSPGRQEATQEGPASPADSIPDREWNTELMRNVTIRRKRKPDTDLRHTSHASPAVITHALDSPTTSPRPRRQSGLRERVQASSNSPRTPSIEQFANAIGWPSDEPAQAQHQPSAIVDSKAVQPRVKEKRNSDASLTSTVEALIIVTPPRRTQTLRHSGRNMAYTHHIPTSPTRSRHSSAPHSTRASAQSAHLASEDIPLNRLVHKRAAASIGSNTSVHPSSTTHTLPDRKHRVSADSDTLGSTDRVFSARSSFSMRTIDSSAATLAHQEVLRRVLQPAADTLVRHNSIAQGKGGKRIASAPEAGRQWVAAHAAASRERGAMSPPASPSLRREVRDVREVEGEDEDIYKPPPRRKPSLESAVSRKEREVVREERPLIDVNKSLPQLPKEEDAQIGDARPAHIAVAPLPPQDTLSRPAQEATYQSRDIHDDIFLDVNDPVKEKRPPSALMARVRQLVAEREAMEAAEFAAPSASILAENKAPSLFAERLKALPAEDASPPAQRTSPSSRGRSGEQTHGSHRQTINSLSPDSIPRPNADTSRPVFGRVSVESVSRPSYEFRRPSEEQHRRVSFDRSTIRTEEHAMARHLFAQTTPFSQMSDTPIEVSEATAVSIFPHNNHSLLVVQQVARGDSLIGANQQLIEDGAYFAPQHHLQPPPTSFVDAVESPNARVTPPSQPKLVFEPSTPPTQIALPQPNVGVDSPFKNARPPPEPPKINFIPPTPAEELEKELRAKSPMHAAPPGPPKRSDSHPQRRLSLVQRARRYSDNFISPILARANSQRGRHVSDSQTHQHGKPQIPTVNDEDGSLHPFWRPRGFWDGFDDSSSDTDSEPSSDTHAHTLPRGGDTSDIPSPTRTPPLPRRTTSLSRRLTGSLRSSRGFLIGNSLGVTRAGSNRRRHHVTLPPHFPRHPTTTEHESRPKILIQPPTLRSHRIAKRASHSSLRSAASHSRSTRGAGAGPGVGSWRRDRVISVPVPGMRGKGVQLQYIGLSGVKDRWRERGRERRREAIRRSIGRRVYVETGMGGAIGESNGQLGSSVEKGVAGGNAKDGGMERGVIDAAGGAEVESANDSSEVDGTRANHEETGITKANGNGNGNAVADVAAGDRMSNRPYKVMFRPDSNNGMALGTRTLTGGSRARM